VFLLWRRVLVSWSLAMDERSGNQDLCGSDHRSVIPYIHRRTELYCTSLSCLSLFFSDLSLDPCEVESARAFYNSRPGNYNESRGLIGGLGTGQTLCCSAQQIGVANDVFNDMGMPGLIACHPALDQWYGVSSVESSILSLCCTEHGPYRSAVLSGHITFVAISRSGQIGRRCTIESHCSGLHVLQTL
jgi:hypothetical protein